MVASAHSRLANLQRHFQTSDNVGKDGLNGGNVKISPEVAEALSRGDAVVALESTIISHGMPYPQNLETAKEVEAIVRNNGAVPATIAILDGIPCIGLTTKELERLANLGTKAQKTARRDIAYLVASRGNGATTVSATMFFASMVGIPVFVTGGIGGVHRHGEQTMDISSDLTELGKTPVAVISAGIKSILDIPRTLEYLETQGVTVAAYKTDQFPAFFTETSGCKVANSVLCRPNLFLSCYICNAVLYHEYLTSNCIVIYVFYFYYLGRCEHPQEELTKTDNNTDIALVKNNALVGAKIAVAHARMRQ
ncbi:hypothetical protein AQUCO_09300034v1 [Aquilegia coerulea]|uniref:Pseudouridine-5'-phosphate glycosidase n=1 Tax=Aquilegia coerulea TaxID=218851 RepID=A0A2G5C575_AQUCA|nr:hypothetical protein AQUCO_09300034v1 [Aquilegia coerulea]